MSDIEIGDFVWIEGGWGDQFPCLVLKVKEDKILVDEIFSRLLHKGRVKWIPKYNNKYSDETKDELYQELMKQKYANEYKKYIRIWKLKKISYF